MPIFVERDERYMVREVSSESQKHTLEPLRAPISDHTMLSAACFLRWSLANELGLVVVALYQRSLQLHYVEGLVESIKRVSCLEGSQFPLLRCSR